MSPVIDFSNIHGLDPVPADTYKAEVVFAEAKSAKSGSPKIDLRYKIIGGEYDGRQIFDTLAFHPNALWNTKKKLVALGLNKNFSGDVEPDMLVGNIVTIKVIIEEGGADEDGEPREPRNKVVKVSPASTSLNDILG